MLTYSRWSPSDAIPEVESHVRAHLSSVADPNDGPTTYAGDVVISRTEQDGGVLIVGGLDADADAPYLKPGFDPAQDIRDNPLSVSSIEEQR